MLRTIIIDDEIDAIKSIESIIIEYCPDISIVGKACSVIEGIKEIQNKNPDLVFLDIEMPQGNGFNILESIPERNFEVIFITAYNHYAIKAIKFSALDYILKPIDIDELINAVKKVEQSKDIHSKAYNRYNVLFENLKTSSPCKLAVPTTKGMKYIYTKDIIRIEADGSYSNIFLKDGNKLMVSKNLKKFQELLIDKNFFRIHNSNLVNLEHVKEYIRIDGGYIEMIDNSKVIVSRRRKDDFIDTMKKYI